MNEVARQRAATYACWRADSDARGPGMWAQLGGIQVHTSGIAVPHWNGAYVTQPLDDPVSALAAVAEWFAARQMPYGVLVPMEIDLQPPGLQHLKDQVVMTRRLESVPATPPADLSWGESSAEDIARIQSEAFGDPYEETFAFVAPTMQVPTHDYVTAFVDGEAVGCATAVVTDGVLGIFGVAVREPWRRRGIGAALTAATLHRGRQRGCDLAYLNPSPMATAMYARLGFTGAPPFRIWVPE